MSTILIGFERRVGSFTDKSTGEVVAYSNRILRAITDDGADNDNLGFSAFEEKLKMKDLAAYLNVKDDDISVDNVLKSLINKAVDFKRAPRDGTFQVVGFKAVPSVK